MTDLAEVEEAPLIGVDRATLAGFLRYWKERKWHFRHVYSHKFTLEGARAIFFAEIYNGQIFREAEEELNAGHQEEVRYGTG